MKHKIYRWIRRIAIGAGLLVGLASLALAIFLTSRMQRRVWVIEGEGKRIYGELTLPGNGNGSYPVVVLAHGYGGSYSDNLDYATFFALHGIGCYVFDFCGGSENSKSSGSLEEMSVYTEIADMNLIVDAMLFQPWLKAGGLYLAGKSLGGCVAGIVAGQRPDDVAGLLLQYPFFFLSDAFRPEKEDSAGSSGSETEEEKPVSIYQEGDILDVITAFHGPVMIFNGDQDRYVPLSLTRIAAEAYENAELVVIEGAGHGFRGENRTLVKERSLWFIERKERG